MSRIHLFEFEDQKWFPSFLRNYGTDFLQFLSNMSKMYNPIIPVLEKGLEVAGMNQILDLGSGGGGGLLWLNEELKKNNPDIKIVLTDYYPNTTAFEYTSKQASNISYIKTPIDARDVPKDLKGLRTQFLSLQNAVDSNSSIAIFEGQERSFISLFAMFFSPITVLLMTPFIRPFKLGRILFTYIIPIVPIFVLWDGLVSSLRTYSVKEMHQLVNSIDKYKSYDWEINKVKSGPSVILYLLGTPK